MNTIHIPTPSLSNQKQRKHHRWNRWFSHAVVSAATVTLLLACGGGSSNAPEPVATEAVEPIVLTVGPGEFKKATPLGTLSAAAIASALNTAGSIPASVAPRYAVANYRLEYLTIDGNGREVLASALASVPVKPAGALSPVLGYQHGTITRDADAPSNHAQPSEPTVVLASLGYIVLAADYVGYGSSKGLPHPYLMAIPSAAVVTDLLVAAKYWRQTNGIRDNKQLFLAGYSEGGYTTMAASRALNAANNTHSKSLVAVVPGGGPYQVYVTLDEILKQIRDRNPLIGALITPGFLKHMGSGTREWVRSEIMKQMLGSDTDVVFDPAFLDNFLADDIAAMERLSNVHDWKPTVSMKLFHGRDDQLVSYRSSVATLQAMQARGTPGSVASLTDCNAQPADHLGCVAPYWYFLLGQLTPLAKDL